MHHRTPPDLAESAWRAVRACAFDVVHLAARSGRASLRVQGVQLLAQRIGTSRASAPWAFIRLSMRRGAAPAEVTFVSSLPEERDHGG
ncbi:hypothetical protein KAK06_15965 [Ideonella sp. 4Y11]|uniref:Uncharacterized protein n=1 Tax=Ideonella aquatica TaxID=2824119 RepID=A0A941BM50_9BURK|nr:hypothetical protein [Ideonella aquatica]MBQ0960449.1 hypothetical protein [Ideonella aquatica]